MKTILFVVKAIVSGSVVALCCCFLFWLGMYIDFSNFISFLGWAVLASMIFGALTVFCENMYHSCEASNQEKTKTNPNQTAKKTTPVQSNTTTVKQQATSTQSDVKPTKQYPVLDEIQKIISNLMELEKNQDLDKDLFIQFHVLKNKFNSDYQEIVKMLNTLEEIDQFDDNHLESFKNYLDVFKKQQQIIYDNIKQQYNDKLNTINEQLQHFN